MIEIATSHDPNFLKEAGRVVGLSIVLARDTDTTL